MPAGTILPWPTEVRHPLVRKRVPVWPRPQLAPSGPSRPRRCAHSPVVHRSRRRVTGHPMLIRHHATRCRGKVLSELTGDGAQRLQAGRPAGPMADFTAPSPGDSAAEVEASPVGVSMAEASAGDSTEALAVATAAAAIVKDAAKAMGLSLRRASRRFPLWAGGPDRNQK